MAAGNRKKHLELTFARKEVSFLLWTLEYLNAENHPKSHFLDSEQLCHGPPPDENSEI